MRRLHTVPLVISGVLLLAACSGGSDPAPRATVEPSAPQTSAAPAPEPAPVLEVARAMADVEHLAVVIGPRHATSEAYLRAADWVADRFDRLGYTVSRQDVQAPAGNSWGVDVPAGTSVNVIADPPGFDPTRPHRLVGAHLDTIPVAPGAEDNASGVAMMLELARLDVDGSLPVRFIAFGAEEPRGPGDDLHHFGSQQYVAALDEPARAATTAMVSLDRVGVPGPEVPICHGGRATPAVRDSLAAAAVAAGVPHTVCGDNRTSDHWSFERGGLEAARLGSLPYAGYHSPQDTPDVIDPGQMERVGLIMAQWLAS
ncbi:peptidase, M28 family [Aeromicrobium marinum DSM 15272]|uniref:Peptidase, M28 family n=1 Tax=Aeromicrobium marinum DSM 15272 TaxID=585531 RepID=E2SEH7_9ACTN|nr:M28 family peptidase [Aeromicrobium marinum]EFQ82454.1 peptidase, M28 family [Aeromicrobium marinum DSM 15272]